MRNRRFAVLGAAALITAASTFIGLRPLRAAAAFVSSATVQVVQQTSTPCSPLTNWDPLVSGTDETATPDPTRPWTNIDAFTVNKGVDTALAPGAANELQINLSLCAAVPVLPTVRPDTTQLLYHYCLDTSPSVPGMGLDGPAGVVQTGVSAVGGPVFDGPYPDRQEDVMNNTGKDPDGYKFCAFVEVNPAPSGIGMNCNGGTDVCLWGVAVYDPVQSLQPIWNDTMYEANQTSIPDLGCPGSTDPPGLTPTITPPSVAGTSVTFYFPYIWSYYTPAPPNVSAGCALNFHETILTPGETVANGVAQVWEGLASAAPVPTCVPPVDLPEFPACSLAPNTQGITDPMYIADSAPGWVDGVGPHSAFSGQSYGYDPGAYPSGYPYGAGTEYCDPTGAAGSVTDDTCVDIRNTWNYYVCQPASEWGAQSGQDPAWNALTTPAKPGNPPAYAAAPHPTYQNAGSAYSGAATVPAIGPTTAATGCGSSPATSQPETSRYTGGANNGDTLQLAGTSAYGRDIPQTKTVNPSFYDVAQYTECAIGVNVGCTYTV